MKARSQEQLARYAYHERKEFWIQRGYSIEEAEEYASAQPGTCCLCKSKSRSTKSRLCYPCANQLRTAVDPQQIALFRKRERYQYYIRKGRSPEEAAELSERAALRGKCFKCGADAYGPRAEICEKHRRQEDSARARESSKRSAQKERQCEKCGRKFAGKKGRFCPEHRYGHNTGLAYNKQPRPDVAPSPNPYRKPVPAKAEPREIVIGPPKPEPPPYCPPDIQPKRLPPVGLAARSFRDYVND